MSSSSTVDGAAGEAATPPQPPDRLPLAIESDVDMDNNMGARGGVRRGDGDIVRETATGETQRVEALVSHHRPRRRCPAAMVDSRHLHRVPVEMRPCPLDFFPPPPASSSSPSLSPCCKPMRRCAMLHKLTVLSVLSRKEEELLSRFRSEDAAAVVDGKVGANLCTSMRKSLNSCFTI